MPSATETIGTGETYTTPWAWEAALPASIDQVYTGECKAEEFVATFTFDGHTTDADNYYHLTAESGAEHDGRAHELSGLGNARLSATYNGSGLGDDYIRVSWLEWLHDGNVSPSMYLLGTSEDNCLIHHCIFHMPTNFGVGGISCAGASSFYRNIIYGTHRGLNVITGGECYNNTSFDYRVGHSSFQGALRVYSSDGAIRNNAFFEGPWNIDFNWRGLTPAASHNCSSDGTADDVGTDSLVNKDATDNLVNATDTWAECDCRIREDAVDLLGAGVDLSATGLPEIDVPISDRSATITGSWSIGADDVVSAGGGKPQWYYQRNRMRRTN